MDQIQQLIWDQLVVPVLCLLLGFGVALIVLWEWLESIFQPPPTSRR